MRAVALLRSRRCELGAARRALTVSVDVPPAVCLERRSAVRAHDAQVLDPIVVADAVDVIEDQRHASPAPHLTLAAELALTRLEARLVEPLLQMATRERRALDEDLVKRSLGHT